MPNQEKTLVGVPFYEKEGQECLDITLRNIDTSLSNLNIDASVIVQLNGPDTAKDRPPYLSVAQSNYNAEIEIVNSPRIGQTLAVNDLIKEASRRGIARAFITDADIYRFPSSLKNMWRQGDKLVVGARYRPYPLEIVEAAFGSLSPEERLLYQIFDGDQSPQVRRVLQNNGINRSDWVKGSLMLLQPQKVEGMHGNQNHTTDSVMNRSIKQADTQVVQDAYFMHMGRVDMADHIKARLRHFRAAAAQDRLESFLHKEINLPHEETMNLIAEEIRQTTTRGDFYAMLYLTRCAVRAKVNDICMEITIKNWDQSKLGALNPISMEAISTYADAEKAISRFFVSIDWDDIQGFAGEPPSTTQERLRTPFDMEPYMLNSHLAKTVYSSLGISEPMTS